MLCYMYLSHCCICLSAVHVSAVYFSVVHFSLVYMSPYCIFFASVDFSPLVMSLLYRSLCCTLFSSVHSYPLYILWTHQLKGLTKLYFHLEQYLEPAGLTTLKDHLFRVGLHSHEQYNYGNEGYISNLRYVLGH